MLFEEDFSNFPLFLADEETKALRSDVTFPTSWLGCAERDLGPALSDRSPEDETTQTCCLLSVCIQQRPSVGRFPFTE